MELEERRRYNELFNEWAALARQAATAGHPDHEALADAALKRYVCSSEQEFAWFKDYLKSGKDGNPLGRRAEWKKPSPSRRSRSRRRMAAGEAEMQSFSLGPVGRQVEV